MKNISWEQLVIEMESAGANNALYVIGHFMDEVEESTGKWPDWDAPVPDWVLEIA